MSGRARLLVLVGLLVACLVVFVIWRPVSPEQLGDAIKELGWAAPAGYLVLSGLLGVALVPGPVLSSLAGLLFGPVWGGFLALGSAVISANIALVIGRRLGRDGLRGALGEERFDQVEGLLGRHGVSAVVLQRILPIPDGPANYAFGAGGVGAFQITVGTLIGSLPRAFGYALFGSGLGRLDPLLAAAGGTILVLMGLIGWLLAARLARREMSRRRAARQTSTQPEPSTAVGSSASHER